MALHIELLVVIVQGVIGVILEWAFPRANGVKNCLFCWSRRKDGRRVLRWHLAVAVFHVFALASLQRVLIRIVHLTVIIASALAPVRTLGCRCMSE